MPKRQLVDQISFATALSGARNQGVFDASTPTLRLQQLEQVVRQGPAAFFGNTAALVAVVIYFWSEADHLTLIAWAACTMTMTLAELLTGVFWRVSPPGASSARIWSRLILARVVLHGAAWGSMAPLFFAAADPLAVLFVVAILLGLAAGGQTILVSYLPALIGYVTAVLAPLCLVMLSVGESTYLGLGILTFIYCLVIFDVARNGNASLLRSWHLHDALKSSRDELQAAEQRYRSIFESVMEGLYQADDQGRFLSVNPALARIAGFDTPEAFLERKPALADLLGGRGGFRSLQEQLERNNECTNFIAQIQRKDGELRWISQSVKRTAQPNESALIDGILHDITERKKAEDGLVFLAHHDSLTGLPNRVLLQDTIESEIGRMSATGTPFAVHLLDLDHFKQVNDAFGHHGGDLILKDVAARLRANLPEECMVARLGGDEFAILQSPCETTAQAMSLARRTIDCLTGMPMRLQDRQLSVGTSLGIALFPEHGESFSQLLKRADIALYEAKALGRGAHCFFSEDMEDKARRYRELVDDLKKAIAERELTVHYQPKLGITRDGLVGAEALVRWFSPKHGVVSPGEFIPIAEETGLIREIGDWVFAEVCGAISEWNRAGCTPVPVAVNLSGRQLDDPAIATRFNEVLVRHGLTPAMVELELTESELMSEAVSNIDRVHELAETGMRIAIDDFGTGHSSLAALCDLPVTDLKIDRRFINDIKSTKGMTIVTSFTRLAHELGLMVTAEGIEDEDQLALTRQAGCDVVQGYWYGRPMPAKDMLTFMSRGEMSLRGRGPAFQLPARPQRVA